MADEPRNTSSPDPAPADPAAARFWMLQLMRLGGVLLVVGGMMILAGKVSGPDVLGYGLMFFGLFEFFWLPRTLARRWKSPTIDETRDTR
ncbi:hypothetical protein GRI62_02105 [Erythrobacter arachoides]|uniref:Uncharacterized protein n=1 Tax=Aurantiacibacter arachoides TaxID=1850444 RepID=A0A845A087_9SPHN|nr:hypothetical protein [Aurantiacibacter arachoides]MXO92397.1 hypothetical protein [Aurantiacibacter arachoides]GGD57489.1 hypothetical protein GCM10011411_16920 [Aurantiacibacter arachoides]